MSDSAGGHGEEAYSAALRVMADSASGAGAAADGDGAGGARSYHERAPRRAGDSYSTDTSEVSSVPSLLMQALEMALSEGESDYLSLPASSLLSATSEA